VALAVDDVQLLLFWANNARQWRAIYRADINGASLAPIITSGCLTSSLVATAPLRIGFVHLFVCLSVCRQNAYTKTRFSQKVSNLELWSLLTTDRNPTWAFQEPITGPQNSRWRTAAILKIIFGHNSQLYSFARSQLSVRYRYCRPSHPSFCTFSRLVAVTDTLLDWFQFYCSGRSQSVSYAGVLTTASALNCSVPQGSVLGPLKFTRYTEDVSNVFCHHGVKFHLFANDKQAYVSGHVSDVNAIRQQLSDCATRIAAWCTSRRLQLNASKTELIWFGSCANLLELSDQDLTITVMSDTIQPVSSVRNLGGETRQ